MGYKLYQPLVGIHTAVTFGRLQNKETVDLQSAVTFGADYLDI